MPLGKGLHQLAQKTSSHRRQDTDPQLASRAAARSFRELGRLVQLRKSVAGLLEESSSGICDSHAGVVPFEQRHTKLVFQGTHVTTHRGLPNAQSTRSSSDAQVLGDDKRLRNRDRVNDC
jgi:hypothetical protein